MTATPKQKLARARNWQLARLLGQYHFDLSVFTPEELVIVDEIKDRLRKLTSYWDSGSIAMGLKVKVFYCSHCGDRIRANTIKPFNLRSPDGTLLCHKHRTYGTD